MEPLNPGENKAESNLVWEVKVGDPCQGTSKVNITNNLIFILLPVQCHCHSQTVLGPWVQPQETLSIIMLLRFWFFASLWLCKSAKVGISWAFPMTLNACLWKVAIVHFENKAFTTHSFIHPPVHSFIHWEPAEYQPSGVFPLHCLWFSSKYSTWLPD